MSEQKGGKYKLVKARIQGTVVNRLESVGAFLGTFVPWQEAQKGVWDHYNHTCNYTSRQKRRAGESQEARQEALDLKIHNRMLKEADTLKTLKASHLAAFENALETDLALVDVELETLTWISSAFRASDADALTTEYEALKESMTADATAAFDAVFALPDVKHDVKAFDEKEGWIAPPSNVKTDKESDAAEAEWTGDGSLPALERNGRASVLEPDAAPATINAPAAINLTTPALYTAKRRLGFFRRMIRFLRFPLARE